MILWIIPATSAFIALIPVFKVKAKEAVFLLILDLIALLIMFSVFNNQVMIIKGYLFAQILIFAAWRDVKTREIPDAVHLLIAFTALLNINLIPSILGLVIVSFPFLLSAILKEGSIGGGDIKLMAASDLLLGAPAGIFATIIGLIIAILTNLLRRSKSESFALAPYLAVGCLTAYIIF